MASKLQQNVYGTPRLVTAISKSTGYAEEAIEQVFNETFRIIHEKIMEGKTVQVKDFGTFRLKHMGRRVSSYYPDIPELNTVTEEYLKITFLACADLRRRADRKLQRQKRKEAKENADTESE